MIKVDSASLIYSLKMDYLEILGKLYKEIIITKSVFEEVIVKGKEKNKSEAFIGEELINKKKIQVHERAEKVMELRLGLGESEIIQNSLSYGCPCIIDDKKAKKRAGALNLDVKCIPLSLLEAYKSNLIDNASFDGYLNKWIKYANPSYDEIYFIKKFKEVLD